MGRYQDQRNKYMTLDKKKIGSSNITCSLHHGAFAHTVPFNWEFSPVPSVKSLSDKLLTFNPASNLVAHPQESVPDLQIEAGLLS